MNIKISNIVIVILAAGQSSRLGSPKQLLTYKGKNLLRHTVDEALETGCPSVFVVLGANSDLFRKELKDKPVMLLENADWEEGMASSIRYALKEITGTILRPDSIIIMVCDQPYVSSALLLDLVKQKNETGKHIVACRYNAQVGTPALFHRSFFPALMELKGDKGAKKLIADHPTQVATILFPDGEKDIDTKEDYESLNAKK
jgi:molybdenum cofactor cytidylyltransferase